MTKRASQRIPISLISILLFLGMGSAAEVRAQASSVDNATDKDRIIADLLQRVEALERKLANTPGTTSVTTQVAPQGQTPATTPPEASGTSSAMPSSRVSNSVTNSPANELADEENSRALERTLIREGGLVLPARSYEIEPRVTYEYRSSNALQIVNIAGQTQVSTRDLKRDAFETSIGLRAGLPWTTQLDVLLPYARNRERRVIIGGTDETDRDSGFGNLEVGITKQFLTESKRIPGMLGTLRWRGAGTTEEFNNPAAVASSFRSLQAGMTLVKRQDPMVFFGGLSHTVNYSKTINGASINPGNGTGLRLGSILALSPDTSMRLGFQLTRSGEIKVNGEKISGSSATAALFDAGFSFVLSPTMLLGVEAGIGLTPGSPDFRLGISLPIRF